MRFWIGIRRRRAVALDVVRRMTQHVQRWIRPARVHGAVFPPLPGALRLGAEEEEAAVDALRALMRSRRLSRIHGLRSNPFEHSPVRTLEKTFAKGVGTDHALAVSSGTAALVCGLAALEIGPGDEVIVPGYTWIASATAVLAVGAVPILAEVDASLTLDPEDVRRKLSPYTRAIMPVHMRGAPCNMNALMAIAKASKLKVLEDVAQANGGRYEGKWLGSIGDMGAFSFQFAKIMTCGEGGMLTTKDEVLDRRATMYHDASAGVRMCLPKDQWLPGLNYRMSELQGAVALVQLGRMHEIVETLRCRKQLLRRLVAESLAKKEIRTRVLHDPGGEVGVAFIFFLPEKKQVDAVVRALCHDRVRATALYRGSDPPGRDLVDFHVYSAWEPLMNRSSWSANGGPWRWHARDVEYRRDMCPNTLDLLSRAVHIDVGVELSEKQVHEMAASIRSAVERFT